MAWSLPGSEFLGLDLASRPIERGKQMVHDVGLANLRLLQGDLTDIPGDWGPFDYIIAHGLYSWVPPQVRDRLLEVCRALLAPQGIAFVSYNTLPGGHLRNMVREMLLFHVRDLETPEERVRQASALVQFLAQAQNAPNEYRRLMMVELERIQEHVPGHLYHDELAKINQPVYFTQFMDHAAHHQLQYLGEADFFEMSDHAFPDSVRETLEQLAAHRLLREQYLDFLKCRCFRQTLLCRSEVRLHPEPQAEKIARFLISSGTRCGPGPLELRPGVISVFETAKGAKCQTDLPAGKAALAILSAASPMPLPFGELHQQVCQRLAQAGLPAQAAESSPRGLCEFLLKLYAGGTVEFRTFLPPIARHAGERPMTHPLARWQAAHGDSVSSLFHIAVKIEDDIGKSLLTWLDGTLDRKALLGNLWAFLQSKNALTLPDGDESAARRELEANLERNLGKLVRLGLLVEAVESRGPN